MLVWEVDTYAAAIIAIRDGRFYAPASRILTLTNLGSTASPSTTTA